MKLKELLKELNMFAKNHPEALEKDAYVRAYNGKSVVYEVETYTDGDVVINGDD